MAQPPHDDPLGIAAGLNPPSEAAAQRAKPLFDRLVQEVRANSSAPAGAPQPAKPFGGGRRYDLALALAMGKEPSPTSPRAAVDAGDDAVTRVAAPPPAPAAEVTRVAAPPSATAAEVTQTRVGPLPEAAPPIDTLDDEVTQTTVRLPPRPPPGAPSIRPPARRPAPASTSTEGLLEKTADTALLRTEADGSMSFDIAFRDDVFRDLACTISVHKGRAVATFRVGDDNTRRLLEAEVGRLRAGLEGKGLKVEEVRVELRVD